MRTDFPYIFFDLTASFFFLILTLLSTNNKFLNIWKMKYRMSLKQCKTPTEMYHSMTTPQDHDKVFVSSASAISVSKRYKIIWRSAGVPEGAQSFSFAILLLYSIIIWIIYSTIEFLPIRSDHYWRSAHHFVDATQMHPLMYTCPKLPVKRTLMNSPHKSCRLCLTYTATWGQDEVNSVTMLARSPLFPC